MKILLIVIAWVFVLSLFALAYTFYDDYKILKSDLKLSRGTIASKPSITRDEYDTYNTSLRFYLEGEDTPVSVPGKLLNKAKPKILELKAGDQVSFYEKKPSAYGLLDRNRRTAMGLEGEDGYFYTLDEALTFYQSNQKLMFAFFFAAFGVLIIYFLLRN